MLPGITLNNATLSFWCSSTIDTTILANEQELGYEKQTSRSWRCEISIANTPRNRHGGIDACVTADHSRICNADVHCACITPKERRLPSPVFDRDESAYASTPDFSSTQTTQLEKTQLDQDENLVSRAFPATEMWAATVSQPLRYVPGNFQQADWNTASFFGALYKGTGSPEYRTEDLLSPPKDNVKALAISAAADSIGNMLGINLSQANEFLDLLSVFSGTPAGSDFGQHIREAREEQRELEEEQRKLEEEQREKQDELDLMQSEPSTEQSLEENQEKAERLVDEIGKLEEQIGQLKRELENTRKIINGVQRAFEAFTNPKDEN